MEKHNFIPSPIDTTNVNLPRRLNSLAERLAKNSHEVWVRQRLDDGWTYGTERNETLKHAPSMVPYEELPEQNRRYARTASMETLKIITKMGFSIVEKPKGTILLVGSYSEEETKDLSLYAEQHGLNVVMTDNWEDAKVMLKQNLLGWHAIVLDALAKLNKGEAETPMFLRDALDDIAIIFSRRFNEVPWYIMPRIYNEEIEIIIKYTVGRDRYKKEWGKCVYTIDQKQELLKDIAAILPQTKNYRLRSIYDKVFQTIEAHFPQGVRELLFNVLQPLHSPESFFSFVPSQSYDNVRRSLEAFFIACCNYQLIPSERCYDHNNSSVNLRGCSDYISNEARNVFPKTIAELIENILNRTNRGCHFEMDNDTTEFTYSVMSLALQFCDIIVWFGDYVRKNNCISIHNLIDKYLGLEIEICQDAYGNYYYDKCSIPRNNWVEKKYCSNSKVKIVEVTVNTHYTRKYYPLSVKVGPVTDRR